MDDERIIELYWQRSEQALEATDRKYGRMCRSIAWNLLGNHEDVEECVNDTYYGLWNAIPPARPLRLPSFIAKITRNLSMKRITYLNARKRDAQIFSLEELEGCVSSASDMEQHFEGKVLTELLVLFLDSLDLESRNIFLRRYWFFDSIDQIARGMGITQGKVKSRLHRTRNKLKDYLAEEAQIYVR